MHTDFVYLGSGYQEESSAPPETIEQLILAPTCQLFSEKNIRSALNLLTGQVLLSSHKSWFPERDRDREVER